MSPIKSGPQPMTSFTFSYFLRDPGFPGASVVKNPSAKAGDVRDAGSIPRLGRFPGEGNGNPLQCSNLENPMDRGACWATVYGVTQRRTQLKRLSSSKVQCVASLDAQS